MARSVASPMKAMKFKWNTKPMTSSYCKAIHRACRIAVEAKMKAQEVASGVASPMKAMKPMKAAKAKKQADSEINCYFELHTLSRR